MLCVSGSLMKGETASSSRATQSMVDRTEPNEAIDLLHIHTPDSLTSY